MEYVFIFGGVLACFGRCGGMGWMMGRVPWFWMWSVCGVEVDVW